MKKKLSKQYRWQLRQKEKGLCVKCGEKAINKNHCKKHAEKERKRSNVNTRKRLGLPEDTPLKRGRPFK